MQWLVLCGVAYRGSTVQLRITCGPTNEIHYLSFPLPSHRAGLRLLRPGHREAALLTSNLN